MPDQHGVLNVPLDIATALVPAIRAVIAVERRVIDVCGLPVQRGRRGRGRGHRRCGCIVRTNLYDHIVIEFMTQIV